jgi:hypothetical protein
MEAQRRRAPRGENALNAARTEIVVASRLLVTVATVAALFASTAYGADAMRDSVTLPLRVHLTDGSSVEANAVGPWWDDFIQVVDTTGRTQYLSRFKIASIRDARDLDLTKRVILGRKNFGEQPQRPPVPPVTRVPEPYRVTIRNEGTLPAAFVGSSTNDFVRIIDGGGARRYVPAYQIQAVVDSNGADVTRSVLDKRKSLGIAPSEVRPWRPPSKPRSPISGVIAQGAVLFRTGGFDHYESGSVLFQVDIGGMKRVGERYGIGATAFYSGDDNIMNVGVKARGRRLLGHSFVVDLAPGAILATSEDRATQTATPAFVCEADVTFKGWLSMAGQVEARDRQYLRHRYDSQRGGFTSYQVTDNDLAWYLGFKIGGPGGLPAVFVTSALLFAFNSIESTVAPSP